MDPMLACRLSAPNIPWACKVAGRDRPTWSSARKEAPAASQRIPAVTSQHRADASQSYAHTSFRDALCRGRCTREYLAMKKLFTASVIVVAALSGAPLRQIGAP